MMFLRSVLMRCSLAGCVLLATRAATSAAEPTRPELVKLPFALAGAMENTPLVYQGRPLLLLNHRDDTKYNTDGYAASMYLYAIDLISGQRLAEFGQGHSFVSGFVDGETLHVFASEGTNFDWFGSLYHFWTDDLKTWQRELAIERPAGAHLFNCSVCREPGGYLMAYESNQPVQFSFRFARSRDLHKWELVPDSLFTGQAREYSACPVIRYFDPYYYVIYLHAPREGHNGWLSYLARSQDLKIWQLSPFNPLLEAEAGEGKNNSDVDLFEYEGRTYLVYATGDQATWSAARLAQYNGPMQEFFEAHFPAGAKFEELTTSE